MCFSCAGELDIWCIAAEKASPPIMPPKGLLLPDLCPSKNAPVSWKVSWEFGYAGRFFVNFYWNCCTVPFNSVNLLLHFVCLFRQKRAEIPYNSSRKYNAKKLLHLSMQELFWSCYPDSNWGPHPYQGLRSFAPHANRSTCWWKPLIYLAFLLADKQSFFSLICLSDLIPSRITVLYYSSCKQSIFRWKVYNLRTNYMVLTNTKPKGTKAICFSGFWCSFSICYKNHTSFMEDSETFNSDLKHLLTSIYPK